MGWLTPKRDEVDYVRWHAIVHMSRFVAHVQDANASHANPYACAVLDNAECFRRFTRQSLRLCGFPTAHTPILTPVQAPNNSHANRCTGEGSQKC
ncbi:hypothetical protein O181_132078 [Austropuccinia psidii MF-1]|uniref:Uncharacterized protein n=1 Tax=Austropuccinia psidii MF-1 TaxID=1389203 RepID=A0A9Q3L1P4_9BASI|nr:hypothetical protein [Austropuccinia psidii MF-1]